MSIFGSQLDQTFDATLASVRDTAASVSHLAMSARIKSSDLAVQTLKDSNFESYDQFIASSNAMLKGELIPKPKPQEPQA